MPKVFVSYSSRNEDFVENDVRPAIDKSGNTHWYAPRNIEIGAQWRKDLLAGLEDCDRVLIVVSKQAVESDYVKLELAGATHNLIKKSVKVDARRVHRAFVPVQIDVRGRYGEKYDGTGAPGESLETPPQPYVLHPYLALVNCLPYPHSSALERVRSKQTGKLQVDPTTLTPEQRRSIADYEEQRARASAKLLKALKDPEALRWGFKPLGRVLSALVQPAVQRVAVAGALLLALLALLPPVLRWADFGGGARAAASAPDLTITANGETPGTAGIPLRADTPITLAVRAQAEGAEPSIASVTLLPTGSSEPRQPPTDPNTIEVDAGETPTTMAGDVLSVLVRQDPVAIRLRASGCGTTERTIQVLPTPPETPRITLERGPDTEVGPATDGGRLVHVTGVSGSLLVRATANGKEETASIVIENRDPSIKIGRGGDDLAVVPPAGRDFQMTRDPMVLVIESEANGLRTRRTVVIAPPSVPAQPEAPESVELTFGPVGEGEARKAIPYPLPDERTLLRVRAMSGDKELASRVLRLEAPTHEHSSPEITFPGARLEPLQGGWRLRLTKPLKLRVRAEVPTAEPKETVVLIEPPKPQPERKVLVVRNYEEGPVRIEGPGIREGRDINVWIQPGETFAQLTYPGSTYELFREGGRKAFQPVVVYEKRMNAQDVQDVVLGKRQPPAGPWIVFNGFDEDVRFSWRRSPRHGRTESFLTLGAQKRAEFDGRRGEMLEFRPVRGRTPRIDVFGRIDRRGREIGKEIPTYVTEGPLAFRDPAIKTWELMEPTLLTVRLQYAGREINKGVWITPPRLFEPPTPPTMTALVVVNGYRGSIPLRRADVAERVTRKVPGLSQGGLHVALVPRGSVWEIYDSSREAWARHVMDGPEKTIRVVPKR